MNDVDERRLEDAVTVSATSGIAALSLVREVTMTAFSGDPN
jgi:hypothetical protein